MYQEAQERCSQAGARLCDVSEVLAGVAMGIGCLVDYKRVWTGTDLSCPAGQTLAGAAGVTEQAQALFPMRCYSKLNLADVVCCAFGKGALPFPALAC